MPNFFPVHFPEELVYICCRQVRHMIPSEEPQIIQTADGSHSVLDHHTGESFHSLHGAVAESTHVFIRNGFLACQKETIHILEVGFGTGLNALLTLLASVQTGQKVVYVALEPNPLPIQFVERLNYPERLPGYPANEFKMLHHAEWEKEIPVSPNFVLVKHQKMLEHFSTHRRFDLVYFDAFSPVVQPGIWQKEIFDRLYALMEQDSILVTYAAKGQVRRNMQEAGFQTERLPGAPGKREMLRAKKTKP